MSSWGCLSSFRCLREVPPKIDFPSNLLHWLHLDNALCLKRVKFTNISQQKQILGKDTKLNIALCSRIFAVFSSLLPHQSFHNPSDLSFSTGQNYRTVYKFDQTSSISMSHNSKMLHSHLSISINNLPLLYIISVTGLIVLHSEYFYF